MRRRSVLAPMLAGLLAVTTLAGCAYRGGDVSDPIGRKATWFSFVEGTDIRNACRPGAPDRYRLVYNANYEDQVRVYEIGRGGAKYLMTEQVFGGANVLELTLDDPLNPWRGKGAEVSLTPQQHQTLLRAFEQSGMFAPPPVGLELPSRSYYWTAAFCHQGRYGLTAWRWPDARWDQLGFMNLLLQLDVTGVPVEAPRKLAPRLASEEREDLGKFTLKMGENGLVGLSRL